MKQFLIVLLCLFFQRADFEETTTFIPDNEIADRIVGGTNALLGELPFIVSIRLQNRHVCGGSILNDKYILTAAHCVYNFEKRAELFSVQYGILELTESEPNVIGVKKIIRHADYVNKDDYRNDIGVLELKRKITFNDIVKKVNLATKFNLAQPDSDAEVAGWGLNATGGHLSRNLKKVTIKIFSEHDCAKYDASYNINVHICAGYPDGGRGQCTGDSGGPLTVDNIQYGIVSWSRKPCASKGHPGYFTEVAGFRDWIFNVTGV